MTPQDQEFLHDAETGVQGDCARAVIACLLGLPIKDVPHFADQKEIDAYGFYNHIETFLACHGKQMLWNVNPIFHRDKLESYHYISGPSPRGKGVHHCVVGLGEEVFFDPHPSRAGLAGDSEGWAHSFLLDLTEPT